MATIRSLKSNSGGFNIKPGQDLPDAVTRLDLDLLALGSQNLGWHIQNAKSYGIPVVVAINRFPQDHDEELDFITQFANQQGAFACAISDAYTKGGAGTAKLANAVVEACQLTSEVSLPYQDNVSIIDKIQIITKKYGASRVNLSDQAKKDIDQLIHLKLDHLPICMVKTPLSISADPNLKNVPVDFTIDIRRVEVCAGAGFIRVYTGNVMTMPGLGSKPAYRNIDIDIAGNIIGLT